jgi:uncharacterized membrane protein
MKMKLKLGTAAIGGFLLAMPATAAPFFQGLGDLPGGSRESVANGISADGSTVVGSSVSGFLPGQPDFFQREAFRWTASSGMVGLGDLPGGTFASIARGVSADGSVVVGEGRSAVIQGGLSQQYTEAFRWTASGGMVGLGNMTAPGGSLGSVARGVSADGSVVVGQGVSVFGGFEAFRWTVSGGMVGLGSLNPPFGRDPFGSGAFAVSPDGGVVVGVSEPSPASGLIVAEAFRWTGTGGMVGLGDMPSGGGFTTDARAVSADGSVVVGRTGSKAFRWTAAEGVVGLFDLPPGFVADANAVSADGRVIVGSFGSSDFDAFIWDADKGMRLLVDVLRDDYGLAVDGFQRLSSATGISADGKVIVGTGLTSSSGRQEAFIANLRSTSDVSAPAPVPAPATLALLAPGAMLLFRRRRPARLRG